MFCNQCGYTMDPLDKECQRCHGTGKVAPAAQATPQVSTPTRVPSFDFGQGVSADDKPGRFSEKHRKIVNRVLSFLIIFFLTQYGLSLYNRHSYEQALLKHYNEDLRARGSSVSCTSAELYGFGLFGTRETKGYIHCSDGLRRRATWAQRSGRAVWDVEDTGQRG